MDDESNFSQADKNDKVESLRTNGTGVLGAECFPFHRRTFSEDLEFRQTSRGSGWVTCRVPATRLDPGETDMSPRVRKLPVDQDTPEQKILTTCDEEWRFLGSL